MQIRLSPDTFVRHHLSQSLVFDQHSAAQLLLEDAGPFLRFLSRESRPFDVVLGDTALALNTSVGEIAEDFGAFVEALLEYGFLLPPPTDDVITPHDSATSPPRRLALPPEEAFPGGEFYRAHQLPFQLHMDLTDACNERCIHCYIPKREHHFLPLVKIEKVLREFRELQGMEVILSGGEPMLHPQFKAVASLARQADLAISLYSNATLCDQEMAQFLRGLNIRAIQVSLYSMDPATHDRITGLSGSLRSTMMGLRLLQDAGIPVWLNTPVLRENFRGYREIVEFARHHGIRMRTNYGEICARTDHDTENLGHILTEAEMQAFLEENVDIVGESLHYARPGQLDPEAPICEIMAHHICLDSGGSYYPCESCHGYVLGDCTQSTLQEVWNSNHAVYLRGLRNKDFPDCMRCSTRSHCRVCIVHAFNDTGSFWGQSSARCLAARIRADYCNRTSARGA